MLQWLIYHITRKRVLIGQQPPSVIIQGRGGATESCENICQFFCAMISNDYYQNLYNYMQFPY
jgi:hypothetical protein